MMKRDFWNLESTGINSKELDEDDNAYIKAYQDRSIEFRENKYFARLPWQQDHDELPTNLAVMKRRTENVIKRLTQKPDMLQKYGNIIQEQERRGFIERVDETAETEKIHIFLIIQDIRNQALRLSELFMTAVVASRLIRLI
ncbi:uncharacterized protein LOC143074191 [Mytilus galloprovincialis]|uniref:uncharacterized protein LOC143074191 n=1 Tax=Mytilus galloprovincialis TaxID=29158 RepID=UPI003F7BE817